MVGHAKKKLTNSKCKVTFKENTAPGTPTFFDIKTVGWINVPLNVGVLQKYHQEGERHMFEFNLNGKTFIAWSVKCGEKNAKLLKVGFAYTLQGTMIAKGNNGKWFRSTNAKFKRITLLLCGVEIVKEEKEEVPKSNAANFAELSKKIESQKSFIEDVKDITIISGKIYRYIGCENEKCFAKLQPKRGKHGIFCSNKCRVASQKGKVCILLKDVSVAKDEEKIDGVTIFHSECIKLFGATVANEICRATSDRVAEIQLVQLFGKTFNARMCNQKQKRSAAVKKLDLILKEIIIDHDEDDSVEKSSSSTSNNIHRPPTSIKLCKCETLEDADDMDNAAQNELPLLDLIAKASSSVLSDDFKYDLNPHPRTGNIGLAFVVNIKYANGEKVRKGSQYDVDVIEKVLPKLGIGIYKQVYKNMDKAEYSTTLKKFKKELVKENYSCAMVIVMGHGMLHHIRMKDDYINVWSDVLAPFSEENFSKFLLKPKIFIMHSCQSVGEEDFEKATDFQMEGQRFSDCLWITPCLPGVKAKRNKKTGTHFIQNFMNFLDKFGSDIDLVVLINVLQEHMRKLKFGIELKEYNIPVYCPMIFNKAFYFAKNDSPQKQNEESSTGAKDAVLIDLNAIFDAVMNNVEI